MGRLFAFFVRRIGVDEILDDFCFDPECRHLIGAARESQGGQVPDIDSGRIVARIDPPGMPHLGSGITWDYQGRPVMATPNLNNGMVSVIDMQTWQLVKRIKTLGPAPGKTAAHVEFNRDGSRVPLSIWDMDGAFVVYNSSTLEELKRLPMVRPSGKYNVYNKISLSRGTSH